MKLLCLISLLCCHLGFAANQKIVIGVPQYAPPYVMVESPQIFSGFDIDLMNEICSRLQWDCEYKPMKIKAFFSALTDQTIDFLIGAIAITRDRRQQFLFSIPYMICEAGFSVLESSSINNVGDLQGKRVGVLKERIYYDFLSRNFLNQFTIVPYERYTEIFLAARNGDIDAVFGNYYSALYMDHQWPNELKVLKEHFPVGEGLGIATLPANKAKMDQINKVLLQIQADGTFSKNIQL
ncbi:arginine ABC transporter substrate-binding protein [Legionella lansingensis]|uniref:Arginine ABC transporter substrate-binding protein n=1 Tax=Legionella lansingensis TaxID=45067 RepID=A0A0W0VGA0_9GAMM|nr:transporter substrate-binding domain-containing protein [Legionella lansingensis]KTD19159.1 arginine ABC transporter substrate-binding protein [Legionella lansingensis]SNV45395.1 arginine ABC transporter substrate-binding protein [Legionella lansingensis]